MSEASQQESNSQTLEVKRPRILDYDEFAQELEGKFSGFEKIYEGQLSTEKEVRALLKRLRPTRRDVLIAGGGLALATGIEYARRKVTSRNSSNKPTANLQTTRNVHKDEAFISKSPSDTDKNSSDNKKSATTSYVIEKNVEEDMIQKLTTKILTQVPQESYESAKRNIPLVLKALKEQGLTDPKIVAYTVATIEHETAKTFEPIEEIDGENQAIIYKYSGGNKFYGRGFIQLTHDYNYAYMSLKLGTDLINNPTKALEPDIAAKILAIWIKEKVRPLLLDGTIEEFESARKGVNATDKASEIAKSAKNYLDILKQ